MYSNTFLGVIFELYCKPIIMFKTNIIFLFIVAFFIGLSMLSTGCAQIGVITGGPKDTLAPVLVKANPAALSKNVQSNKITLEFDEYIDLQDLQTNLIISPLQNKNPSIILNPKIIQLKFRDSLLPNTTYTINFGNAIRDVNEANIAKNLSYTFSTGSNIDSLTLKGNVTVAETGEYDSTMIVMLYKNAVDSTVLNKRPSYIAKVGSNGDFTFNNLPSDSFKIYALKDGDGGKTYNSPTELFGFISNSVSANNNASINLLAYSEKPVKENIVPTNTKPKIEKKLRYNTNLSINQDLLLPLPIEFNNPLKNFDSSKIYLTDTLYNKINPVKLAIDSTLKKITLSTVWKPETIYKLIIQKDAVTDTIDNQLAKTDTISFTTKKIEDYGKVLIRFSNINLAKNPILQFIEGSLVKYNYPIKSTEWRNNMFTPGEYGIRILYDTDNNGEFTTGNYTKKMQPETVVALPQKLSIRANWDNESDINL